MKSRTEQFVFLAVFLLFLLLMILAQFRSVEVVRARKGYLDLSDLSGRELKSPRYLQGEWEFYPGVFLDPGKPVPEKADRRYLPVPGDWNSGMPGMPGFSDGLGYGTYRLTINLPGGMHPLGLAVHDPATAVKVFAGEEELLSIGVPGRNREESIPRYEYRTVSFGGRDRLVLTCHFSNFHHRRGGFWDALLMGGESEIRRIGILDFGISFIILGILLYTALYHLILYLLGCRTREYLYFSLLALFMALRVTATGTFLISFLIRGIPWGLQVKLEYLSYTGVLILAILLYQAIFPGLFGKWIYRGSLLIFSLYSLCILLFPQRIFGMFLNYTHALAGFTALAALAGLVRLSRRREEYALLVLTASLFYTLTYLNDALYIYFVQNIARMGNLIPYGMLALITTITILLADRYRSAVLTSEILSDRLDHKVRENLKLYEDTIRDPLTQLLNRKELEKTSAILEQEEPEGAPLTVVYMDLDNFKEINDTAGHPAGDYVLKEIASVMKQVFRHSDILFRLGGDEFLVILPGATGRGAVGSVERFLREVETRDSFRNEIKFIFGRTPVMSRPLSCSAGVAERSAGETVAALIKRADAALLEAKKHGKNQLSISPPPVNASLSL